MNRISIDQVDLVDNFVMYHNGAPFSGIVYETNAGGALVGQIALNDGIREGLTRTWYPTGEKEREEMYSKNSLHGECREWYRTGRTSCSVAAETLGAGVALTPGSWFSGLGISQQSN